MANIWEDWIEAVRFTCEAQTVISARLLLFASGAPSAVDEAAEMVVEKFSAFAKAGMAAEQALEQGLDLFTAAQCAFSPVRACVRANSDRLLHAHLAPPLR